MSMLVVYEAKLLLYSEVWASAMNPLGVNWTLLWHHIGYVVWINFAASRLQFSHKRAFWGQTRQIPPFRTAL